ncbi:hypothetical protein BDN67DRAFT_977668 [Paxillus ammoniavirescens]|nr:hypothetical protein BDN67DRAFT_977668 [Paxillus ammoniavirescens]
MDYRTLTVTKANTYGLVFHRRGSTNAKSYIPAAHQDVVPVEPSSVGKWKHAPFSGFYDSRLSLANVGSANKLTGTRIIALQSIGTKYYWNLTKYTIRMNPFFDGYNEAHTINEAFRGDALVRRPLLHPEHR